MSETPAPRPVEMAWVDLETTGLDANEDAPLELGIVLTDRHGVEVAAFQMIVNEDSEYYENAIRRSMTCDNGFVWDMHNQSGLWDEFDALADTGELASRGYVDEMAVMFLKNNGVEPRTLPMAGSSIGSLDRPFALRHFPKLNEYLSYRNIDTSSLKEVCRLVNPVLLENIQESFKKRTGGVPAHRVLDDCRASRDEYLDYVESFLFTGDEW